MDTRSKIVRELPADADSSRIVAGFFDPLYAAHVRRLREICQPGMRNVVVIDDPADPVLPRRARAELVAALHFVDVVVDGGPVPAGALDEREADRVRTDELCAHIARRHGSA